MRYLLLTIIFSYCTIPIDNKSNPGQDLENLVQFYWDFQTKEYPMFATQVGANTANDQLGSFRLEDYERRGSVYDSLLKVLDSWELSGLTKNQAIEYQLIRYQLKDHVSSVQYKSYLMPLLADAGFHISFAFLPSYTPFETVEDYENYISRLKQFPGYVTQHIQLLKQGLELGITQPKVIFEGYEVTYRTHMIDDPAASTFYEPFRQITLELDQESLAVLQAEAQQAVMQVIEGYRSFGRFMEEEYIPQTRTDLGASSLPNGEAYYQQRIDHFTTLKLTAKQVHELGLEEVSRIKAEMVVVMEEVGFTGELKEFISVLRKDPQFYAKDPAELIAYASLLSKKADAALPRFFGKLPRQPYGVAPVPVHLAPKYTGGRYIPADINSASPGYFWVNTYDLPSRPFYVLPALTLHEAVPGHHLQFALSQELTGFSPFRKNLYISAFGEGWGLYSEYLGKEMGIYEDPYADFGRLTYEMWRACRLVVDTGIHAFGWTREEVLQYMTDHTALSIHEITTETDRYISWPGQALSYKLGELKIKELRLKAQNSLGAAFNLREFHDVILSQGTLTLPILEEVVDHYIDENINR